MNRSVRSFLASASLSVCVLLLTVAAPARAQLQFTRADIEPTMQDRDLTMYNTGELSGVTFNLGAAGAGQVYDFSGFTYQQSTYQSVFVSPSVTPYAMDYPTATHAQIFAATELAYSYMRLDDNGFYDLGFATTFSGSDYIMVYEPEMPSLLFPLQMGSKWNYNSNEATPLEGFSEQTRMEVEAVSEGILVTPQGSWPALCVRNITWLTTRIEFAGTVVSEDVSQSVNYMFLTKQGVSASLSVDTLDALSWNPRITVAGLTFEQTPNAVDAPAQAAAFGISSVYPHPITDGSTTVAWHADGPSTLAVYDTRGRELRRIAVDAQPGVTQNTRLLMPDLPTGTYLVRLTTPAGTTQRTMLVLR